MERMPEQHAKANQSVPIIYGVFLGPLLLALWGLTGRRLLRLLGTCFATGATAAMADIGARAVVPGANDNLSAVGCSWRSPGRSPRTRPPGVRVLLVSTGSEESFMEGMQAFGAPPLRRPPARRDRVRLPRVRRLAAAVRGRGRRGCCACATTRRARARRWRGRARRPACRCVAACAPWRPRTRLIALRAGYPTCTLGGVDETKFPSNYHWPSDTPDNLSWESVEGALRVCEAYVRLGATR